MLIYFVFLSIPLIAHLLRLNSLVAKKVLTCLCMLFFCFSYMNGSDWRSYETFYYFPVNDVVQAVYFEPGFIILFKILRVVGIDFWVWFILIKCLIFLIFCFVIHKYLKVDYFLGLFLFLTQYGLFMFIDYPFRNVLAIFVFIISLKYVYSRNIKYFLLFWVIGMSLHSSMFMLLPFYYIVSIRLSNRFMIIMFLGVNVFFMLGSNIIVKLFEIIGERIPFLSGRVENYFGGDSDEGRGKMFSIGNLVKFFFFYLFIKYRDRLESDYSLYFVNFVFWFFILNRIALDISILGRITLFFVIFYCIALTRVISYVRKEFKVSLYFFLVGFSFLTSYLTITGSSKYIPYSHALYEYFMEEERNFYQRSEFNFKESPYKNDK